MRRGRGPPDAAEEAGRGGLDEVHLHGKVDLEPADVEDGLCQRKSLPKWHAANWPGRYSTMGGSSVVQTSFANGQRG